MSERRWSRWSFAGLLLLALGFVFHAPAERGSLRQAFSPAVFALSRHHQVGQRVGPLLDSEIGQALLQVADEEVDSDTRLWIRELIPDEAMFGYEPFLGETRTPGWVGVSRVGGRHMRHRALLDWVTLKRYERHGEHHGRILWTRHKEGRRRITLALASGVLVACRHDDADAIREVLDRLDGRRPSFDAGGFPDTGDSDQLLLRPHFIQAPQVQLALESTSDSELIFKLQGNYPLPGEEGLPAWSARFGGPATLAMLRLPPLPDFGLMGESVLLLTGAPFQGGVALFGIPALHVIQARDREEPRMRTNRFVEALERESGRRWESAVTDNGVRILPQDPTLRRFLRGAHVPGAVWTEEVLVYTSSLLSAENLFRRLGRESEVEFELRQLRWRDPKLLFWLDGKRLSAELAFLGQILSTFRPEDDKSLPDLPRMLEGLARLEIAAERAEETNTVRLRVRLQD